MLTPLTPTSLLVIHHTNRKFSPPKTLQFCISPISILFIIPYITPLSSLSFWSSPALKPVPEVVLSQSESESLYGWQWVSMAWCRAHTLRTFDQILLPFQEFESGICCPVSVGCPLWREAGSVLCKSQSSHLPVCTFTINIFVFTHIYHIYTSIYIYI
jgi:hypothetical protein